jgi:hypothetical protein
MGRIGRLAVRAGLELALALSVLTAWTFCARAQATAEGSPAGPVEGRSRILLVLPFDNRSGQPSLEWIREAAPQILSSRFASAGFARVLRP